MLEIKPKHWLGQNFLNSEKIAEKFAGYLQEGKNILEIGPGLGIITNRLTKRAKKVTAVEIDKDLEKILKKKFLQNRKVKVKIGDALKEDFSKFDAIVGALPYNLAAQIIEKFMQSKCNVGLFIVQLEFAKRIIAQPGESDYSRLSILCQNGATAELKDIIDRDNFWPEPEVTSAIVKIEKTGQKVKIDDELVRALFQHKNQNIRKALKHSGKKWEKVVEKIPAEMTIKRGRELSLEELQTISELL